MLVSCRRQCPARAASSRRTRTCSNELCGAGVQPARPRPRAPPTARVAPSAPPSAPPPADDLELVEFHRSPALRRRVHPKRDAGAAPAFTGPSRARVTTPRSALSVRSAPLSDLDVQLAHGARAGAGAAGARGRAGPGPARGGRLISATVDTWARSTLLVRDGRFKPLVFGGTYPIDEPASPPPTPAADAFRAPTLAGEAHRRELRKTIERSLDKFEAILARRTAPRPHTFDIDEPFGPGSPPPEAMPRERDAKYYVAGPETFDIDEPVTCA